MAAAAFSVWRYRRESPCDETRMLRRRRIRGAATGGFGEPVAGNLTVEDIVGQNCGRIFGRALMICPI